MSTVFGRFGEWQTFIVYGKRSKKPSLELEFWIFVDIGMSPPKFFVVPLWWIQNSIWEVHSNYLLKNGGERPATADSKHHAVTLKQIKQFESQWEPIGL